MSLETSDRNQKAVLWEATGNTGDDGEPTVSAAVSLLVRWQEVQDEGVDPQGNTVAIDARVVVDRVIVVGSRMWLGDINDIATPPVNIKQVVGFLSTPDIKNRNVRKTVLLRRASNTLPIIE